ncbi:MAG TPA: hypothetical protein VNV66_09425 [Pilimelia sp.]|nr:hypothetical protein [Pilimelia sp.]
MTDPMAADAVPQPVDAPMDEPDPERMVFRTGAEQPWEPEDLAAAKGLDPTPANIERCRRELAELGPAAIERVVP